MRLVHSDQSHLVDEGFPFPSLPLSVWTNWPRRSTVSWDRPREISASRVLEECEAFVSTVHSGSPPQATVAVFFVQCTILCPSIVQCPGLVP